LPAPGEQSGMESMIARKLRIFFAALSLVALCGLAGCKDETPTALPADEGGAPLDLEIADVRVRATPPGAKVSAAYFTLRNKGGRADRLLGAECDAAGAVELHESGGEHSGHMHMRRIDYVDAPVGAEVQFAPGGKHIMLIDLKRELKSGDRLDLTLRFERAGLLTVPATVTETIE
jgi:periplasmic copper chaperone A